jgi:uncharacterized protein YjbJ (UPF0337 family)
MGYRGLPSAPILRGWFSLISRQVSNLEQLRPEKLPSLKFVGIPDWKARGKFALPGMPRWKSAAWEWARPSFLSFPWIGLDRSGTTVRRITLLLPLAIFQRVCCRILPTSKMIRRNQMEQSTKDEIKGNLHEAKGGVKEKVGQVTNRPHLTAEGKNEELAGKIQKKVGQIEKVLGK